MHNARAALTGAVRTLQQGIRALPTGLPDLDAQLEGGLSESTMITIGGESEDGKSLLVQNMLWRWGLQGLPLVYIDFENGPTRLACRFFALAGFPDLRQRCPPVEPALDGADADTRAAFHLISDRVYGWADNLYLPDPRTLDRPLALSVYLKEIRLQHPTGFLPVVVDSLQKLPMSMTDRRAGIDEWLRELERCKQAMRLTIIATSELPRQKLNDVDPFKDSTGIKYTTDLALVFRVEQKVLQVVKNRDGMRGDRMIPYHIVYPWILVDSQVTAAAARMAPLLAADLDRAAIQRRLSDLPEEVFGYIWAQVSEGNGHE